MTLDIFVNQIVRYFSFLYHQVGFVGGGLFIAAVTTLILLLLILKRRKAKGMNVLIFHNKQQHQEKTSQQWEKAKTHIEKLLYEITEQGAANESPCRLPAELLVDKGRHYSKILGQRRTDEMLIDRTEKSNRLKRAGSLLDVQELQDVATLAKQLRARSRHRVRS